MNIHDAFLPSDEELIVALRGACEEAVSMVSEGISTHNSAAITNGIYRAAVNGYLRGVDDGVNMTRKVMGAVPPES